ncbi:DegV family protein [Coriobacteriia bacterium Es71-Z0120]|uniref:DegV family protein n=1 Tax=Parvivirga hydrogeniphila TaxID=2939460 RepID=UPI0022609879|nr:DegV family protein [Parvivirga hydrogeniphila]MCL4078669.1 DegV family protein [Parvivirga hydrogeniphila]
MTAPDERPMLAIDSCSDLTPEIVERFDVEELHFPFTLNGEERLDDFGRSFPHRDFYQAMRGGAVPTTAQIPRVEYEALFRKAAESGRTLVYLAFSSGLSGTFDTAHLVRQSVLAEFPEADIRLVDTLNASAAEGFLVYHAMQMHANGASADEIVDFVERRKLLVNGYFTLENLETLRRGGRISDAAAAAGTVLDIKPILTIDRAGKLVLKRSVRGRKKSMSALLDIMAERRDPSLGDTVAIAHADAPDEAAVLKAMVAERFGPSEIIELAVGPVIGSHVGPGMLAVVFWGAERER